ncbi:MAG TPA: hypothetical protein VFS08_14915 [Gemmatimonadaceae bacterium]|nr:hypothetical protein [Gemmatimonadaceae bacterium]
MPQSSRSTVRGALGAARPATAGRRRAAARAAFALLLGLTLVGTSVRPAQAGFYEDCVNTVESLTQACFDGADGFIGRAACSVAGGIGILACAAAEAARQLTGGVRLREAYAE